LQQQLHVAYFGQHPFDIKYSSILSALNIPSKCRHSKFSAASSKSSGIKNLITIAFLWREQGTNKVQHDI
jgi:hypothetical protein